MSTKRIVGMVFRAGGLVAIVIGGVLVLQWIRMATNGLVNSGPQRLFGCIGVVSGLFGIVCRIIAARLLRTPSRPENAG